MRLFFAFRPPAPVRERLGSYLETLPGACRGHFTATDNLHLTVLFLGELPGSSLAGLAAAARQAAGQTEPFSLTLSGLGCFGRQEHGCVLWQGVAAGRGPAAEAFGRLVAAVRRQGFSPEVRPYTPHLTLGRQVRLPAGAPEGAVLRDALPPPPEQSFEVRALSLMESLRLSGRLCYREAGRYPLGEENR